MDFGRLGLMEDSETGRRRAVWALIIVLSYSRHSFVWPTLSQKLVDVIEGLEAAWAFFEGVPNYLVIDNFPAVAGVDPLHPRLTRGFLEYSQHRGFISEPPVGSPRHRPFPLAQQLQQVHPFLDHRCPPFSSFLLCPLRMTRWSLFFQTLSLLHHFLGLHLVMRKIARARSALRSARGSD